MISTMAKIALGILLFNLFIFIVFQIKWKIEDYRMNKFYKKTIKAMPPHAQFRTFICVNCHRAVFKANVPTPIIAPCKSCGGQTFK